MIPDEAVEAALAEWACFPPRTELVTRILVAAAPHLMASREALEAAWDDGNCVGLDGWVGPARGEPVDDYAMQVREQFIRKAIGE